MDAVWNNVLAKIEQEISEAAFATWFTDTTLYSMKDGHIVIAVPNVFKCGQLSKKYRQNIIDAFKSNNIECKDIECIVSSQKKKKTSGGQEKVVVIKRNKKSQGGAARRSPQNSYLQTGLNNRYTMDNFVIGSNNDLAVSIAENIIKKPGDRHNPFFLYGGSGLGKTHLIQAIGNAIHQSNPRLKVLYTTTNHFYSEFVDSIRNQKGDYFSRKYRALDVFIVDDFQAIVGKNRSQEEFFNIFNDLYQQNKQIIVTSDRLPSQIKTVDERLASRLTWGQTVDLQMPNFEDKCAILKSKAEFMGVEIEDEAVEYLAENVKTNIRDLERDFNHLLALAEFKNTTPLDIIDDGYINTMQAPHSRAVTPKEIVQIVAKHYDLTMTELRSKSRVTHIKNARQVAMYLLSEELSLSTPKIATEVGVKDHTTVMHGIKRIKNDLKLNFGLREDIANIRESIYA